jgi:hypothetical protein
LSNVHHESTLAIRQVVNGRLDVVLVSACDKLHNVIAIADDHSIIGDAVFERFSQPKCSTVWYYKELARVISGRLASDHRLVGIDAALARWAC